MACCGCRYIFRSDHIFSTDTVGMPLTRPYRAYGPAALYFITIHFIQLPNDHRYPCEVGKIPES